MTTEPRDDLAQVRRALLDPEAATEGGRDCPESESYWRAARGEATPREITALSRHVVDCPDCAAAWSLAIELVPEADSDLAPRSSEGLSRGPRPSRARRSVGSRWHAVAALAASLLLAVTLSWVAWGPTPGVGPVRSGGEGAEIRSLVEEVALPRQDCHLRWQGPEDTVRYELRVTTADLFEQIAEATLGPEAEFRIPATDLAELPPGSVLVWRVRALGPTGELAASTFENPIED